MRALKLSHGFGDIGVIAVVVMMTVVGLTAGFIVRAQRHTAPRKPATQTVAADSTQVTNVTPYMPPGFTRYSDSHAGFSLAYPGGWGTIQSLNQSQALNPSALGTPNLQRGQDGVIDGEQNALLLAPANNGEAVLPYQGGFVQSSKSATGYVWHRLTITGSVSNKMVNLTPHTNANKVTYYDGSLTGEDSMACSDHEYVFVVRSGVLLVIMPSLCPLQPNTYIDKTAKAAYLSQLSTIINSVVVQ